MKKQLLAAFLTVSLAIPVGAADDHPFKIESELDQAIRAGLSELYNFNFEKSLAIFGSIEAHEAEHPMVAFGEASTHWWRISALVLEGNEEESKPFLISVNKCIDLAEAKIKAGDTTGEGYLVLGGALGLLGRWQATNHQWLSAYRSGKKAYKYLVKALEINPKMTDAYMGRGIFDYYVATLPAFVRVLAFIGMGGDPQVGVQELETAARESIYAQTPSKLFLMEIYTDLTGNPDKALAVIEDLRKEYPRSPFMHMVRIVNLYNAGRIDELTAEAVDFEKRVREKIYTNDFWGQAYFAQGASYFKIRKWQDAAAFFEKGMTKGAELDPWKTWSGLYLGYAYDAIGDRDKAKQQYKWVLKQLRRWGSHEHAKMRLSKPFKGTDEDLKKLML